MPAHHPNVVICRPIELNQLVPRSQQANTNRPTKSLAITNPRFQNAANKAAETVPFRIRKMDQKPSGGKLPPVSSRWRVTGEESIGIPVPIMDNNHGVSKPNANPKQELRPQQTLERRSQKYSSETSCTIPSVNHSQKRRGLLAYDNSNASNSTSVSRQHLARKAIQNRRFSSLPVSLSIASDYDIPAVDVGHEDTRTSSTITSNSVLPPQITQQKPKIVASDKLSEDSETPIRRLQPFIKDQPPVPDLRSIGKRLYTDLTLQRLYEMQLRYKNLMQLSKQVQFSSTQVLKGERIRKPHTLPGIKSQNLACYHESVNKDLELLAVLSVKEAPESEPATNSLTHNSVTLGLARKCSNSANSDIEGASDQASRRERVFENRKKLHNKDAVVARRKRREGLKEDSERKLITKAIEMGNTKFSKSLYWDLPGKKPLDDNETTLEQCGPKATVTISGESPVRTSIEITLPDCILGADADNDTASIVLETEKVDISQGNVIDNADKFPDIHLDEVKDESDSITDDPQKVSSVGYSSRELPSDPMCRVESHTFYVGDFLSLPVSNINRSSEVLTLGRAGRSSGMDIPEIRMICATPLPPGSPE